MMSFFVDFLVALGAPLGTGSVDHLKPQFKSRAPIITSSWPHELTTLVEDYGAIESRTLEFRLCIRYSLPGITDAAGEKRRRRRTNNCRMSLFVQVN
jgi:hypothetical protein